MSIQKIHLFCNPSRLHHLPTASGTVSGMDRGGEPGLAYVTPFLQQGSTSLEPSFDFSLLSYLMVDPV